jgi:WD40 repeat protein
MDRSKTFSYSTNVGINCFALNYQANRVILAEPNEIELLTIGEDRFYCNNIYPITPRTLRIMDISWSRVNESLVACGCSTGVIHRFLVTPTDVRFDGSYNSHDKTINRISFHPNNPDMLLSGGQDGLVNLIDIRGPNDKQLTFKHDHEERVTDCQFNTLNDNQFASGSVNGIVYVCKILSYRYKFLTDSVAKYQILVN